MSTRALIPLAAAVVPLLLATTGAEGQPMSSRSLPTRTAFKCVVAGKVTYSDAPCEGAQRVDLQPTRMRPVNPS
jgi:hypothetical protein